MVNTTFVQNNSRSSLKQSFLEKSGISGYKLQPLPVDASARSYDRVTGIDQDYILMDCPPEYEKITSFIQVANFLSEQGFSVPQIYHHDVNEGFILMEDFGIHSLSKILGSTVQSYDDECQIYKLLIEILIKLQSIEPPSYLPKIEKSTLIQGVSLFLDWYMLVLYSKEVGKSERDEFLDIWHEILDNLDTDKYAISLRDYHVDNLMYLGDRHFIAKVGLLDFQDAAIFSPYYDIVSILQDARRKVSTALESNMINYYLIKNPHIDRKKFFETYNILGAQRNCRILGVFARKLIQGKNSSYLKFIPNLLCYLGLNLQHPILYKLKSWMNKNLPQNLLTIT